MTLRAVVDSNVAIDIEVGKIRSRLDGCELFIPDFVFDAELRRLHPALAPRLQRLELDGAEVAEITKRMSAAPALTHADAACWVLADRLEVRLLTGDRALRTAVEAAGGAVGGSVFLIRKLVERGDLASNSAREAFARLKRATPARRLPWGEVDHLLSAWGLAAL